jgi:hypothetical protein
MKYKAGKLGRRAHVSASGMVRSRRAAHLCVHASRRQAAHREPRRHLLRKAGAESPAAQLAPACPPLRAQQTLELCQTLPFACIAPAVLSMPDAALDQAQPVHPPRAIAMQMEVCSVPSALPKR